MGQLDKRFPIYSRLLRLYPSAYHQRYQAQILQTLADMLDDNQNSKLDVWLRAGADLPFSLFKENLIYAGGIMKNEMPHYVKRNTWLSAGLLLPFFIIVFSRVLQHNHSNDSLAWQSSLYLTLLIMPGLAFLLSAYTLVRWNHSRPEKFLKGLLDIRRSWATLGIGWLALLIVIFVPFHDSGPCLDQNPVKSLRNFHQTLHCIQQR